MHRPHRSAAPAALRAAALSGVVALVAACTSSAADAGPGPAAEVRTERITGADRFETAAAVSRAHFTPGIAQQVFLVNGTSTADALVAAPAAATVGAPLLLTRAGTLPPGTAAELGRLQPSAVRVVGGEGQVAAAVLAEVSRIVPGARVVRTAGTDRYDTAVRVAQEFFPTATAAVLARGDDLDGAVAGGAAAGGRAVPLLLAPDAALTPGLRDWVGAHRLRSLVVVGSGATVGPDVLREVSAAAPPGLEVTTLEGRDLYEATASVAAGLFPVTDTAFVASGQDVPGALVALPAARTRRAPLLLSRDRCTPAAVWAYTAEAAPGTVVLLGGEDALGDPARQVLCG
ncbi:hypothetical protein NUM3379_42350 [Kineococcus sp. NUM-3379]